MRFPYAVSIVSYLHRLVLSAVTLMSCCLHVCELQSNEPRGAEGITETKQAYEFTLDTIGHDIHSGDRQQQQHCATSGLLAIGTCTYEIQFTLSCSMLVVLGGKSKYGSAYGLLQLVEQQQDRCVC